MKIPDDPGVLLIVGVLIAGFIWCITVHHCNAVEEKLEQIDHQMEMSQLNVPTTICVLIPLPSAERPQLERLYKPLSAES